MAIDRPARTALLAVALALAGAAAEPGDAGPATRKVDPAAADYLVGHFALSRGDLAEAADSLLSALQADPGQPELQAEAFAPALLTDRPQAVVLAHDLPSNPAARLLLADAEVKAGHWPGAQAIFAAIADTSPVAPFAPLLQAWALQGGGDTDGALALLRPDLESGRYRGIYALHAAMICDQAGRMAEAARLYRLAVVEYGGLNLRLGVIFASFQARTGHEQEARATIRALVDTSPDLALAEPAMLQSVAAVPVATATDGLAETYLAMAANLQRGVAPELPFMLLRLALDLRPDFTAARLFAGEIEAAAGQWEEAAATLAAVSPADPLAGMARLREATYLNHAGQTAEAQALLEQLATAYPSQPSPLAVLAQMQRAHSQFAEAAETYGRAIARIQQPGRNDWPLYYEQGIAWDRAHDWPRAEADFRRALELQPDQPLVLNYLGYAWTEQGRNLPLARRMLHRAVELRPNDGSIIDSLGWALLKAGDSAAAVSSLERAVELLPEDSTINGHLGDAYQAAGRLREAEVQWRRALILNPDPAEEVALKAKLAAAASSTPVAARHPAE